jgi:hypothetical protein
MKWLRPFSAPGKICVEMFPHCLPEQVKEPAAPKTFTKSVMEVQDALYL